jgi:hypothetical protein
MAERVSGDDVQRRGAGPVEGAAAPQGLGGRAGEVQVPAGGVGQLDVGASSGRFAAGDHHDDAPSDQGRGRSGKRPGRKCNNGNDLREHNESAAEIREPGGAQVRGDDAREAGAPGRDLDGRAGRDVEPGDAGPNEGEDERGARVGPDSGGRGSAGELRSRIWSGGGDRRGGRVLEWTRIRAR